MDPRTIALLHPGEMGASVGAAAAGGGHRVVWVEPGRSAATAARAREAGLEPRATLADALADADVALSVCPPHAAVDVAGAVADAGFRGLYVDANAVSPQTAGRVAARVEERGARFADGGIIGPPVRRAGTTRLYLSGPNAAEAAALFDGSPLAATAIDGPREAASALKACYAAWTKGSTALLADIRALARASAVEEALLLEWAVSQAGLAERSESSACGNAFKAWRWIAEMEEIADAFAAAGLPDGFHRGAAEVYRRLARFKDTPAPTLGEVTGALLGEG